MNKNKQQAKRRIRTRSKVKGSEKRPRLSVYRSNVAMYAQIIDDGKGKTLVSVSEKNLTKGEKLTKSEKAKMLGTLVAKKAKEKKITSVVFDRGSYAYHGRVKQLAEGAREGGLQF